MTPFIIMPLPDHKLPRKAMNPFPTPAFVCVCVCVCACVFRWFTYKGSTFFFFCYSRNFVIADKLQYRGHIEGTMNLHSYKQCSVAGGYAGEELNCMQISVAEDH